MKKYNIYCDESSINNKDLLFMGIGAIQVEREYKNILIQKIKDLKIKHNYNLEMKWRKVSPKTGNFYKELVSLYFESRCDFFSILIDKEKLNLEKFHNNDEELAFYKYYYFLLKNRFKNENTYYLFLDQRNKKDKDRVKRMSEFFDYENQTRNEHFKIQHVGEYDSSNHILIQLADFLIGAVCYDNNNLSESVIKKEIITLISGKLKKKDLKFASYLHDEKFNIFKIKLQ